MADATTPQANALEQPRFWTLDRIADALGAGPRGVSPIARIDTDTRQLAEGSCFVALKGPSFDGHDFLAKAVEAGARTLVVSDARRAAGLGVPVYEVDDTLAALGKLGRYRRRAWRRPVIGVVGTNGKTSTKELLRAALGSALEVHATVGNYNNLVGVPLMLLAIPDHADVAVIEMGTSLPGEVSALRGIAAMPTPAMRVNVAMHGAATVINDAYNSNPGSALAALELLGHVGTGRQRVAVLGTMLELGPHADRLHDEVARAALSGSADLVVGVGAVGEALRRVAPGDARTVSGADPESAWNAARSRLARDAVILLKGSRGVRLERLLPVIAEWAQHA